MEDKGFILRGEKCLFGVREVMWFGHRYSEKEMAPDPNKVKVIQDWPEPMDKAKVKSFLQTSQFCSTYKIPVGNRSYSDVTLPLRRLTNKQCKFYWSKDYSDSFKELRLLLTSNKVMANRLSYM